MIFLNALYKNDIAERYNDAKKEVVEPDDEFLTKKKGGGSRCHAPQVDACHFGQTWFKCNMQPLYI